MVEVGRVLTAGEGRAGSGRSAKGWEAGMGKAVAYALVMIASVIVVGWVAVALLHALLGSITYLIVGAVVVGGGVWLYGRAKRSLAPGTRTQRRIEAASKTYRMRNR
jgi:hypothetical protein